MNPLDIHKAVQHFLAWDTERISALLTGFITATLIGLWALRYALRYWTRDLYRQIDEERAKSKQLAEFGEQSNLHVLKCLRDIDVLNDQKEKTVERAGKLEKSITHYDEAKTRDAGIIASLRGEIAQHQDTAVKLSHECEQLKESAAGWEEKAIGFRRERLQFRKQLDALREQIASVLELEGRIWVKPPGADIPVFQPLNTRRARIIAVANLKGGVGKTTLTAHLGSALAERGFRVLLVDLDHQGSLTRLCLPQEDISRLQASGPSVVNVLGEGDPEQLAWDSLTPIPDTNAVLLAAVEELDEAEAHAQARWLLGIGGHDVRYVLRAALHSPRFRDEFDVILLDCPPRLTTASINALTCCDYLLSPLLLDKTSTDAGPCFLRWIQRLQEHRVCPELTRAGIVGNRSAQQNGFIARELDVWKELQTKCRDVYQLPLDHFKSFIPSKAHFAAAAEKRTFGALDKELKPIFDNLLRELQERKVIHESPRVAIVP